jgi:probable HAF family extracellular repeat protein
MRSNTVSFYRAEAIAERRLSAAGPPRGGFGHHLSGTAAAAAGAWVWWERTSRSHTVETCRQTVQPNDGRRRPHGGARRAALRGPAAFVHRRCHERHRHHTGLIAFVLLALGGVSPTCVSAVSFEGVGDLPGGYVWSDAKGVSADGRFVVGTSYLSSLPQAYRRMLGGGMIGLGTFPSPHPSSAASAVSADGNFVVGSSNVNNESIEVFRWTQNTGLLGLGDLPGGIVQSFPFGISADGNVVVGFSASANGREAFRWTQAGGMVGLGDLPQNDFYSEAYGVSADGSVVVGYSRSASGPEAFRWTQEEGMVGLGAPDQNQFESRASAVSADGSVVVGYAFYPTAEQTGRFQPFRWTQAGGMAKLGDLPNGVLTTQVPAVFVSANAAVVVGTGYPGDPFIWDAANGMRNLRDVLVNQYGLDLTGWTLTSATGISADGLTIVGNGVHAGFGNSEGWVACLADFDSEDVWVAVEAIFDPAKARCNTDCNRDDAVSAADVSCVIHLLGH